MVARFDLSVLSRRRSAKFALVSLTVVVITTLVSFTARAWLSKSSSISTQGFSQSNRLTVKKIAIRPTGFEPKEVSRPAGRVWLSIRNHTGLDDVSLILEKVWLSRNSRGIDSIVAPSFF